MINDMFTTKYTKQRYFLYSLAALVFLTAAITLIFSVYRLQRDANLLNRPRKRDYVTNKISRSFPTIVIIISIIVCLSSIFTFILVLLRSRTEILIITIVSNLILGVGLIILSVIMLGFIQNIVDNFPLDIERLLIDFIVQNKTSARDELLRIEDSNDCCTTQDRTWKQNYSQAAECNRDDRSVRLIYADQDEQRGCVKIIRRTALLLMPMVICEMICGCLCVLLSLWTIYMVYQSSTEVDETAMPESNAIVQNPVERLSLGNYGAYETVQKPTEDLRTVYTNPIRSSGKWIDDQGPYRNSYSSNPLMKTDRLPFRNTLTM